VAAPGGARAAGHGCELPRVELARMGCAAERRGQRGSRGGAAAVGPAGARGGGGDRREGGCRREREEAWVMAGNGE
jgi:hypothetical protein